MRIETITGVSTVIPDLDLGCTGDCASVSDVHLGHGVVEHVLDIDTIEALPELVCSKNVQEGDSWLIVGEASTMRNGEV